MNELTGQGASHWVLVVDDDEFSREVTRKKLALLGLTDTQVVGDGRVALRALSSVAQPPGLIVCDIFMPDMDGIEFVSELAKRRYRGGLILITGLNCEMLEVGQAIAKGRGLKLLGCLTKPLHEGALARALGMDRGATPEVRARPG